jgi:hypothetical protein
MVVEWETGFDVRAPLEAQGRERNVRGELGH